MSVPFAYYGHGSRMSADLKQVIKRVRANRPDLFREFERTETSMDGNGVVTPVTFKDAKAKPPTPAARHALSMSRR